MHKILYIQPIHKAGMDYLRAKKNYEVVVASSTDHEVLKKEIKDADVIISRLTPIDADLMAAADHLKAICKHGVGLDNFDLDYCKAHNIAVLTTGDANSSTVAEQAMIAIGCLFRRNTWLDSEMRKGNWASRDQANATDLMGKNLGLVGYGRIGKCLARMAGKGFEMNVYVYDPYASKEDVEKDGYIWCEKIEDLLPLVDVLSPHVPLTPETRGIIGEKEMKKMKEGSFIINYARGGVVDEKALYENLVSGHIKGAALDTFEVEPPDKEENPLFQLDSVIFSPHCATFTEDSRIRMSMRLAQEIEKTIGE